MNIVRAKDEKERILAGVVRDLCQRFGEGAIVRLGDCAYERVGGIPCSQVTEIYGPQSSGKTTLCQHIIAKAQRRGGIAVFVSVTGSR
jgi:recombination protein RecA